MGKGRTAVLLLIIYLDIPPLHPELLMSPGLSTSAADGNVDLTVELEAPAHVASGSTFLVRIV
jgi:hypothetical protein